MQSVSQKWKDNQSGLLVGESAIALVLRLTDPDAYESASASSEGEMYFSQTGDVVGGVDYKMSPITTFEQNQWLLDDSCELLDSSDYGTTRYIGNQICKLDKTFNNNPLITISFPEVYTNPLQGVTITWSTLWNEYAEEFIITAYNGDKVVATETVTDNTSTKSVVEVNIEGYNRITIEIVRWSLSYRRARIEEIVIGADYTYYKSDLFAYNHTQSVNPLSTELPKVEVNFSINNLDNKYNPHNPNALSKYLIERQEVKVKYGYKIGNGVEWIDAGRFYLSEWDAPQDGLTAEFVARDLLEFMRGDYFCDSYYFTCDFNIHSIYVY